MAVEIPHVAVALGIEAPDEEDIIEILVHLGATKEVSSFEIVLQNWEGKYSPSGPHPILVGALGGIGIGRGVNAPAIISLKIEGIKYENPSSVEKYVRVTGRCWGEALFRRVVTKSYANKKGEFIVKDLIDNYTGGLGHTRGAVELIEDTDTTYTLLEYENTPVWDILKYIASSSDKAGVIGYDFRIAPDGNFEFFPINSKVGSVSVLDKLEVAEYSKDISRVRNKITIYGFADRKEPVDGDLWTEALTGWASHNGDLSLDGADKKVGSFSIRDLSFSNYSSIDRTVTSMKIDEGAKLNFWFAALAVSVSDVYVRLCTDDGNYFEADIPKGEIGFDDFDFKTLTCGKGFQYDAVSNPTGTWRKIGTPSWYDITKIWFYVTAASAIDTHVDGLFFSGLRFKYTAEDAPSQAAYGLRELTETDEELWSDNECELRAKALLAYLKDPAEYLKASSTVIDYALTPLLAADKVHIHLPNEGIDADFRTDSMVYRVDADTQTLELTFELGKIPPMLADYLYGLRRFTVNVESLARTKLGKKGIPSGAGGGVDTAFYHHTRHEVGDSSGVKWATAEAGGMDSLTGWIAPSYIAPFSDVAAVIWFRTENKAMDAHLNHIFAPTTTHYGMLGTAEKMWNELWINYITFRNDKKLRWLTFAGAVKDIAWMKLDDDFVFQNPEGKLFIGADMTHDIIFGYNATGKTLIGNHANPVADSLYKFGDHVTPLRWLEIAAITVYSDSLYISGTEVLTSARVLQNVTANASIINAGRFPIGRLPAVANGLILEGTGGDMAEVEPDGRYVPASHADHPNIDIAGWHVITTARELVNCSMDAGLITSGVLAGARIPDMGAEKIGWGVFDAARIPFSSCPHYGGTTADVDVAKVGGGTRTLHFVDGKYTGFTDS